MLKLDVYKVLGVSLDSILKLVLEEVTPKPEEKKALERAVSDIIRKLLDVRDKHGWSYDVMHLGSTARDTWLSGSRDIDIFLAFPLSEDERTLEEVGVKAGIEVSEGRYELLYSSHPYVRIEHMGFEIDIVPCYKVSNASQLRSAVDRTQLHQRYLKEKLTPRLCGEIRLMKAFAKGIGVYGAETKTRGFSGYLLELLVLYYGSFLEAVRAASRWKPPIIIDIERYYTPREAREVFDAPIIVVDPVDRRRNAAAAVGRQALSAFIAASSVFLAKPSILFFKPPQRRLPNEVSEHIAVVVFKLPKAPPDVQWSQLEKACSKIRAYMEEHGAQILGSGFWTDEVDTGALAFKLASWQIPEARVHYGPFVWQREASMKFIERHLGREDTAEGPFIQDFRWVVVKKRESDVLKVLKRLLSDSSTMKSIGVPSRIAGSIEEGYKLFTEKNILELKGTRLEAFLTKVIDRTPQYVRWGRRDLNPRPPALH